MPNWLKNNTESLMPHGCLSDTSDHVQWQEGAYADLLTYSMLTCPALIAGRSSAIKIKGRTSDWKEVLEVFSSEVQGVGVGGGGLISWGWRAPLEQGGQVEPTESHQCGKTGNEPHVGSLDQSPARLIPHAQRPPVKVNLELKILSSRAKK